MRGCVENQQSVIRPIVFEYYFFVSMPQLDCWLLCFQAADDMSGAAATMVSLSPRCCHHM
jgi:hypothetical protein